jgi:hypothetical protein
MKNNAIHACRFPATLPMKSQKRIKKALYTVSKRIQGTFTHLFYTAVYKNTSLLSLHCSLETAMSAADFIIPEQAPEINPFAR